jgi:hypothetical protein
MSVPDNREAIGFASLTPSGIWYDGNYSPKLTDYNNAYDIWADPATSTVVARDNLIGAEKVFFPLYREFYGMVKASPLVSDGQLESMGFPPRSDGGRSHHPVDKLFVDLNVQPMGNLVLSVAFTDRDTGKSNVPYYLTGAVVYYSVGDAPVANQNQLPLSKLATRSPLELKFEPEQRGKTITLAARWQNRRGELGPWSEMVTVIIP